MVIRLGVDRLGPWWTVFSWGAHLYRGELIQYQSVHGDLACSYGGVDMLVSDMTYSNI
jgi:hypothetical protein